MSPGEWIALASLISSIIGAAGGLAWFVGARIVALIRHLDRLDATVERLDATMSNGIRAEVRSHTVELTRVHERLDTLCHPKEDAS